MKKQLRKARARWAKSKEKQAFSCAKRAEFDRKLPPKRKVKKVLKKVKKGVDKPYRV